MSGAAETKVIAANPNRDWPKLYTDQALRNWQVPGFASSDPGEGTYRHPYLSLSDLPIGDKTTDDLPYDVICADVVLIDADISLKRDTYIYARNIVVTDQGKLTVDRIDDADYEVFIVTQAILPVTGEDDARLPISVVGLDDDGSPTLAESAIQAKVPSAIGFKIPPDADMAEQTTANELADMFLSRGQDMPTLLNTQFLIASLVFSEDLPLARAILSWIDNVLAGDDTFNELAMQARGLLATVVSLSKLTDGSVLVPTLDHDIYADSAKGCLELLKQRQQRYTQLQGITADDRNWEEDVEAALADKKNEATLYRNLEKQAEDARRHAEQARAQAAQNVSAEMITLERCRRAFDTGIVQWKRSETQSEAIKIVTNSVGLLSDLPALVTGSPAALKSGTDMLQTGADLVSKYPGFIKKMGTLASDKAKDKYGSLKDWAKDRRAKNQAANPRRLDDNDDDNDDDRLIIGNHRQNAAAARNEPSADDMFDDFENEAVGIADGPDKEEYLTWRRQQKEWKKHQDGVAADRKKKTAEFKAAAKSATAHGTAIIESAMRIAELAKMAEEMEASSTELLNQVNAGVKVALGGADLTGINTATGGEQEWEKLALAIEKMFDEEQGGIMVSIKGGSAYRNTYRTLIIDGRAMCMALLALAKANSDLAIAKLRRRSADEAVALFKKRLDDRQAKVLKDELFEQSAFDRVVEAKRSVFLALETYRRAFAYFTLLPDDKLPVLPNITMPVDDFSRIVTTVSGRLIAAETINNLYGAPSTLNEVELTFDDVETLETVRLNGGWFSTTIDTTHPLFKWYSRVRIHSIEVYFDGVTADPNIPVWINTNGVYQDRPKLKPEPDMAPSNYVTRPETKRFVYKSSDGSLVASADIAPRYTNDFFLPTPFTTWKIGLGEGPPKNGAVSEFDLSNLQAVRIKFHGEYCA